VCEVFKLLESRLKRFINISYIINDVKIIYGEQASNNGVKLPRKLYQHFVYFGFPLKNYTIIFVVNEV